MPRFVFSGTDLISHHLLQVNAGHRLAAANALKHAFFEVCVCMSSSSLDEYDLMIYVCLGLSIVL